MYILLGMVFLSSQAYAQNKSYDIMIPRDQSDQFFIVESDGDTVFVFRQNGKWMLKHHDLVYSIVRGTGRKKDHTGEREYWKHYLISTAGDTLLTLREEMGIIEFRDSGCIFLKRTPGGWKYVDSDDQKVCELELLWNDMSWKYKVDFRISDEYLDAFKKMVLLRLVRMAQDRSACPGGNNDYMIYYWLWLTK